MSDAQAIGIDIGGTKMAVALVDSTGVVIGRVILPTEAEQGFRRAVARLEGPIVELLEKAGQGSLQGIGIGCAGPLDSRRGLINNPYTLTGWNQCDIVSPLRKRFGVPVYLENDADVAAFGECACGAGRGFNPVVMLTFGTGIGGAVIMDGDIYRGADGEHPELGHVPVSADGLECYCGIRGCLESEASGTALGAAGAAAGFGDARAVFAAAAQGNPEACAIVDRARHAACMAAWTICHTLLPQRLVLGGGIMDEQFDLFAASIREHLQKATQFSKGAVSIEHATLGNDAGIVGAAMLVFRRAQVPDR
jgi:glucokinase